MASAASVVVMTLLFFSIISMIGAVAWIGWIAPPVCPNIRPYKRPRVPGKSFCCSKCYPERPGQFDCVQPIKADGSVDTENEMVCSTSSGLCEPKNNPGRCPTDLIQLTAGDWTSTCPPGTLGI